MKIDNNNEIINAGRVKAQNINTVKNSGTSQKSGSGNSQELQNISNKRAYIDAIAVSQMAHNFFQTAFLISTRLKNIANEAVLSGSIDREKLNEALSEINVSLNDVQETKQPVSVALQDNIAAFGFTGIEIDLTEVKNNFNSLNSTVYEISAGKQPDLKKIDRINDYFSNNISKINNFIKSFSAEFFLSDIKNINADVSRNLLNRTNGLISDYPQAALNIQGNINREAAANLTQNL